MDSILYRLTRFKKVKLTMKSLRPNKAEVNLETLANLLTPDPAANQSMMNQVAVMYISLDGVDADSLSDNSDGLKYSFPSNKNPLHQLVGMFYTLSYLVKDIRKLNTIKNTTIILDEQKMHVAYLQEGNDILVFAMPAAVVSVSELNILLLQFCRLIKVLFGSLETVFAKDLHSVLIDNILTHLFNQTLTLNTESSWPGGCPTTTGISFIRHCQQVPMLAIPEEIKTRCDRILSQFEGSNFSELSDSVYGCRRQFTVLGSAFFHHGLLICSHLAPEDLHDLHIYLNLTGVLDLTARHALTQFVAWKEVFPTRFCDEVTEINNNFGFSEPNSRWFWLIIGLKHSILGCLLETVGPASISQTSLPLETYYVDQAKSCLLQLQTPQLQTAIDVCRARGNTPADPDYCATYLNNTSGNMNHVLFSENRKPKNQGMSLLHSKWGKQLLNSVSSTGINIGVESFPESFNSRQHKMSNQMLFNESLTPLTTPVGCLHRLSSSKHPSIFQYCCLDGLKGTVLVGNEDTSSGVFHSQLIESFYLCCRKIHSIFFNSSVKLMMRTDHNEAESSQPPQIQVDLPLGVVKEHGILLTCAPHSTGERQEGRGLEYWVVGHQVKNPHQSEVYVCFPASAPQNMMDLVFNLGFG